MFLFCNKYTENTRELQNTINNVKCTSTTIVVLEDDGFLPDEILSPYEYFIVQSNQKTHEKKELHYNFLEVPEFWEICADGTNGVIYDMGCKKAAIYFKEPIEKRIVQRVEWCMENGWICKIDFYNKYGMRYASEFLDKKGKVESKVFFTDINQEVIVEQPQNGTITLSKDGRMQAFCTSYDKFMELFVDKANLKGEYALFIQNDEEFRLLNTKIKGKNMWKYVLFQNKELLDKYISMDGKDGYRFYAVPEIYPINRAAGKVLILTASDQIEGIEYFVHELPEIMFYIGANTQVSDKLYKLAEQVNVEIYPQISSQNLNALWDECDFYFDINYYREIYDAVNVAHQKNLLIMGFEDTVHDRELVTEECIFFKSDCGALIRKMKQLVNNSALIQNLLLKQQKKKRDIWNKLVGLTENKEG
ncbi:accessory Sec system glycosyltransferase GtfB [Roseburia hominis]